MDALTLAGASSTLVVTTTSDAADAPNTSTIADLLSDVGADGAISLREAISAANGTPGVDTIHFDIAGMGTHTIAVCKKPLD